MKRFNVLICLLLTCVLMHMSAHAVMAQQQTIRIAAFNLYPAIFQAEDGTVQGFYVDFLKEIASREGWKIEYVYGDWADGLTRLKSGQVDLLTSVAFSKERAGFMDYGNIPLLTVWSELYVQGGSSLDGIRDIKGKKVALMKGDFNAANFKTLVEKLEIPCTYVEVGNFEEVFKAISTGKADAGVANNTFGAAKQREYGVQSSGVVFSPFDVFFTTAKGKNGQILATLDKYLDEWRKSGDSPYHQARKRWFHKNVSIMKVIPASVRRAVTFLVIISSLAIIFIIVLRLQVRRKTSALTQEIESRKLAEAELQKSNSFSQSIIDSSPDCIKLLDLEGRLQYMSPGGQLKFGIKEMDKFIDMSFKNFWRGESRAAALDALSKAQQGQQGLFEGFCPKLDGTPKWWEVIITPVKGMDGKPQKLLAVARDISERKLLEENLHIQTAQLEEELAECQVSQEALQDQATMLEEEIEERRRAEEALVQSEATVRDKLKAILEPEGDIATLELSDIIDCEMLRSMLEDFYNFTGMLGAVLDVSGKVLVAVGWQDICTKFHRCHSETVKNCIESDTILTTGVPPGTFKAYRCKNNMWDMVTPLVVGGRHLGNIFIGQFFYEDEIPDVELFREQARRYGFNEAEYLAALDRVPRFSRERAAAGMHFYVKLTGMISTLSYSSIKLSRMLAERIHLEEQLRQSQKMEAVGQLAGGVAHDFNNILQVISGYGSLLKMDNKLDEQEKEKVDHILSSAERAAQLTKGLLAFSRKQVMAFAPVNLNDIIENVKKFLVRIIGEDIQLKTITYETRLKIYADTGQIEQVLTNLVANARDAMQKGGLLTIETVLQVVEPPVAHELGGAEPGRYAVVTVSDTGSGMDEETCKRIFEPFYTTKEVGKGTGLGMAIVYGIIKQHNGFVDVSSEPGQGTTFRIRIPIYEAEQSEQEKMIALVAPPQGGTETILLAEDDADVRKLVVSVLTSFGYNVIQAVDGQDVVDKFAAHSGTISMVLMDMIMPKKNGREAYEEISLLQPGIKVLFSSGYTADFIQDRGVSEEGIELIMKPVQPMELLRKVREMLNH